MDLRPWLVGLRGLPDRHAPEVRAIRVRVADALHDRQPAILDHVGRAAHRRMEPDVVCQLAKPISRQTQLLAMPGVILVAVRDDGVDAVVAPVELDHDQDAAVAVGPAPLSRSGERKTGRVGASERRAERSKRARRVSMGRTPWKRIGLQ